MRITDNFLFHHTADALHDQVLHTASIVAVILLATAAAAFAAAMLRSRNGRGSLTPLSVLAVAIAFMLTPLSAALWHVAPEMSFLQFPWRLLAILAPAVCVAIAVAIDRSPLTHRRDPNAASFRGVTAKKWGLSCASLAIVAALTLPAVSIFRQPCDDEDTVAARLALFNAMTGTDPTDEYTPSNADNDSLAHADPAFWLAEDPDAASPGSSKPSPVPMHFAITAPKDEALILNLRDYPAWQVRINDALARRDVSREDGLISIPVHPGPVQVDIAYASGRDYAVGDGISLAACAAALALGIIKRRGPRAPSRIIVI